ncbi:hypothetical protein F4823DRAFT_573722 [Ustulina deusta]|nr:hypothetical protein F4823DRAFT_573722 [Ustulina deusta]
MEKKMPRLLLVPNTPSVTWRGREREREPRKRRRRRESSADPALRRHPGYRGQRRDRRAASGLQGQPATKRARQARGGPVPSRQAASQRRRGEVVCALRYGEAVFFLPRVLSHALLSYFRYAISVCHCCDANAAAAGQAQNLMHDEKMQSTPFTAENLPARRFQARRMASTSRGRGGMSIAVSLSFNRDDERRASISPDSNIK